MFIDTIPGKVLNIVSNLLTKDDIYHSIMRNNSNVTDRQSCGVRSTVAIMISTIIDMMKNKMNS